jgi:formylglycine-generating enzyme required for sulfatase activity
MASRPRPVRQFKPNGWGLYDMHGNVSEWVEDCLHQDYGEAPDDGRAWLEENNGDCSSRVVRDGSWLLRQGDARCAYRYGPDPFSRNDVIGFRVVCSSPIAKR